MIRSENMAGQAGTIKINHVSKIYPNGTIGLVLHNNVYSDDPRRDTPSSLKLWLLYSRARVFEAGARLFSALLEVAAHGPS